MWMLLGSKQATLWWILLWHFSLKRLVPHLTWIKQRWFVHDMTKFMTFHRPNLHRRNIQRWHTTTAWCKSISSHHHSTYIGANSSSSCRICKSPCVQGRQCSGPICYRCLRHDCKQQARCIDASSKTQAASSKQQDASSKSILSLTQTHTDSAAAYTPQSFISP